MSGSVYKVIELVGTSEKSWEEAAKTAVETAAKSLKDLRVAEVTTLDMRIENNKVVAYRAKFILHKFILYDSLEKYIWNNSYKYVYDVLNSNNL